MIKIKDLNVGGITSITLVVISATARETKTKKPYLQLELYDGTDTITGNYWDWTSGKVPEKNSILDVKCQVTEYLGTKQLNIKSLVTNTDRHLSEFSPNAGVDLGNTYKDAYELTLSIDDQFLRTLTLEVLEQLRNLWLSIPGAKGVHHAFVGGTLVHCLSVAKIALAISKEIPLANKDLCIAGGLLHDLGKLWTYSINGIAIEMTDEGQLFDHTYMGARFISNFAENFYRDEYDLKKGAILEHIILSHHGSLEYGAAVPPMCIEAHIVHKADGVDAAVQQIIEASRKVDQAKWTERIYTLANRPQLTPQYVGTAFPGEVDEEELPFK
jgi:3'-5' exoribonuclease